MRKNVSKKNREGKSFATSLKTSYTYQLKEFSNHSNLHGVHFITAKKRPFYERFIWFCFFVASLTVTVIMIFLSWEKFQTSPTITGLDTDFYQRTVPFPAITVCPQDPVNIHLVKNFIVSSWGARLANDSKEYTYYEIFITKIANLSLVNIDLLLPYENDPNFMDLNFQEITLNMVISCEELLVDCSWLLRQEECCHIFRPVLTDEGFCFTFNSKHYERNWTNITRKPDEDTPTRFVFETDVDLSLKFSCGKIEINPLSIFIHSSVEKVGSYMQPHHVWTRRINKISFSSEETYTTENAKQLSIKQRRCVFPDEIRLVTEDVYTYGACMTQCRMNIAKLRCGCVPFFYSPGQIDGYTSCNLNGLACIARHKDEIRKGVHCECELSCMNTVYTLEKLEKPTRPQEASVAVGFASFPLIRYKRDVLLGWVYLFVAFGGIAGLFLGFSVLTAIETFYFFTLRAFCMACRDQHKLRQLRIEHANTDRSEANLDLASYFGKEKRRKGEGKKETPVYLPYLP